MDQRLCDAARQIERQDFDGAERELLAHLAGSPDDADAHHLLGLAHLGRGNNAEAMSEFAIAIEKRPPFPAAMIDLAVACNRTGAHELAVDACEQVLERLPGQPLALVNLGMAYKGMRRLDDAARAFERAGEHPMARFNLGHVYMLQDDLRRGLPLLEYRRGLLRTGEGLAGEPWKGERRPDATLLVIPEQGLGDVVLMSRFFPTLADRFARVVVLTPPPLARLVAAIDARLDVVTTLADATWDVWAPIMSLPLLLGLRRVADLPTEPWIRVAAPLREDGRMRVGINWAGNPSYAYDHVRSTSLESFLPLLEVPGIEWVSLHRGTREHEAEAFGLPQPLRDAADFLDTARVIAGLDLVISTETAVPNLSAAMGVPTCVMCVQDVDWRWGSWYRGVTVAAQQEPGNWNGPIAAAAGALCEVLDRREAAKAA